MPNYVLNENAVTDLSRMRSEIRQLRKALVIVQQKLNGGRRAPQFFYVESLESIPARIKDEPGLGMCRVILRWGQGLPLRDATTKIEVVNASEHEIRPGARLFVARDQWRDYYIVDTDETGGNALFLTPEGGVPAASEKFMPGKASCQRLTFNRITEEIDQSTMPQYEDVYNIAGGDDIPGDTVIIANKIDGAWFATVVPCVEP